MFEQIKQLLLGNKVSQTIVEWQQADRLSFILIFICAELFFQMLWSSLVWFNQPYFGEWINFNILGLTWLASSNLFFLFLWILYYLRKTRIYGNTYKSLQILVVLLYTLYMTGIYLAIGLTNIFVGVTLVIATILGFFLLWQRLMLFTFLFHIVGLIGLSFLPFFGIDLPNLYTETTFADSRIAWHSRGSAFWNLSYLFWSLPKAILGTFVISQAFNSVGDRLEEAHYVINYDELTKVKNRRFIMQHLYNVLFLVEPNITEKFDLDNSPQDLSVIMLDVDHFKSINDTHGHLSGDMVLIELAKRLDESMVGIGWEVSRYGGEEFLAVLPQTSHADAMQIAGSMHQILTTTDYQIIDGIFIEVTSSFGVATFSHEEVLAMREQYHRNKNQQNIRSLIISSPSYIDLDTATPVIASQEDLIIESLINMADSALYDAKRLGRNRIVSANQYVDESNSRAYIESNLQKTEVILRGVPVIN